MSNQAPLTASPIEPSRFEPLSTNQVEPPKRRYLQRWPVVVIALAFTVIMGFLFTARSLEITVQAESEVDLAITGGLHLPFGDRYLLRPGEYQVAATAPGYYPLDSALTVTEQDRQVLELVLLPLPGRLTVNSHPAGATVTIDGELAGTTPVDDLPVAAGDRQLLFQAERYLSLEQVLTVRGREIQQQLDVALKPAWAELSLTSAPSGAQILVDGEVRGNTPGTVEVLQGEHQISLQLTGFASWQLALSVSAGMPQDLGKISLEAAAGVVQLRSNPSAANVTLDGEFQGNTPLTLEISPDQSHRLAVFKPGYKRHNSALQLAAGESVDKVVRLVAQLGEVKFNLSPADAMLSVDGRQRGRGTQTLELPAHRHSIEVSLPGHVSVSQQVTPRAGLQQVVSISLQTEQQARLINTPAELTTSLGQTLLLFNPGDFTMGASRRESGRRANEVLHPVSLSRKFYLQTTEVTNAQFRLFQASHSSGQIEGNSLNREHQPVVQLSWQQAAQFCNWLSQREELEPFYREINGVISGYNRSATGYRLPTEAEWAWAARMNGEASRKFTWGDTFPPTQVLENYADNTSAYVTGRILNGYKDGHVVSAAVASFPANHNGLYDIGGNVAEWVHDVYSIPPANGAIEKDPSGAQTGDNYVIRGASWAHSKIAELRLSHRDYGQAGRDDVGFRIARYAE